MTDVARRQARSQKQRLDTALLERRRRDALAELGENLYELVAKGEIELDELPELGAAVQEIEEIDRQIAEAEQSSSGRGLGRRPVRLGRGGAVGSREREAEPGAAWGGAPVRGGSERAAGRERVWRPTLDAEPDAPRQDVIETEFEVETVSDRARPPARRRAQESRKSAGQARVTGKPAPAGAPDAPRSSGRGSRAAGGGIVFVEDDSAPAERDPDDSLEAYMNEDDVPRRRT